MLVTVVLRRLGGLRAPGFGAWGGRGEAAARRWAGRPPEDPPCRERSCVVTSAPLQPRSAPLSEMPGAELCGKPRTEVFPSPKGSTTNNTVFEAPKFTSFIPVALGWVSLPETGEASPMLPCSKWAVQGPWHHLPECAVHPGSSSSWDLPRFLRLQEQNHPQELLSSRRPHCPDASCHLSRGPAQKKGRGCGENLTSRT